MPSTLAAPNRPLSGRPAALPPATHRVAPARTGCRERLFAVGHGRPSTLSLAAVDSDCKGLDSCKRNVPPLGMPARKKTSDRVSTKAARLLRILDGVPANAELQFYQEAKLRWVSVRAGDVRSVSSSAMGQDETPRKVAKRGKRRA